MSNRPFIVWTFQRTGGTSLCKALAATGEIDEIEHEPFNRGRAFGEVAELERSGKLDECRKALNDIFESGVSIKHCFELHGRRFNDLLIEACIAHPRYNHLVLMREDERGRVLSRTLALLTGVWGKWKVDKGGYDDFLSDPASIPELPVKDMVVHAKRCIGYYYWLVKRFEKAGLKFIEAKFEHLYEGDEQSRLKEMQRIFEYLGFDFDEKNRRINQAIFFSKQGSEKIMTYASNYEASCKLLDKEIEKMRKQHEKRNR